MGSKNLLFFQIRNETTYKLAETVISKYKPEKSYIVFWKTREAFPAIAFKDTKIEKLYNVNDLVHARYQKYMDAPHPPVDQELLDNMAHYEPHIIKMLERHVEAFASCTFTKSSLYNVRIRLYHEHLRYWNHLLDSAEIGMVVLQGIPHWSFDYIIYCLCKIKNIPTVMSHVAFPPRWMGFFVDFENPYPTISAEYESLLNEYKDKSIDDITLEPEISNLFNLYTSGADRTLYSVKPEYKRVLFGNTTVQEKGFIMHRKTYDKLSIKPDFTAKYIYFALHLQPEATTTPLGGWFAHQILAIKMLSYYLPDGHMLYVKEHPNQPMKPYARSLRTYESIANLKNVKLVDFDTDTFDLIENAIAVSSITGTVGFEGLFAGKPFLMFGMQSYMYAPGVYNIRTNKDCEVSINDIIENGAKHTLKDLKIWIKAMSKHVSLCTMQKLSLIGDKMLPITKEENDNRFVHGYLRILDVLMSSSR